MIQNFDFHIHTSNSDGDYNIDEIIKKINENNIEYFAITDHDNIDSIEQLKDKKLNYITGIEFSGRFKKYNMHILGYYLDGDLSKVKLLCDKIKELRKLRLYGLLDDLNKKFNISFEQEEIDDIVSKCNTLGRPHIGKLLIKHKYVDNMNDAFLKYLNYLHTDIYYRMDARDITSAIHSAGGIVILAHPKKIEKKYNILIDEIIEDLIEIGIDGIEIYNSIHYNEDSERYLYIANKYNLYTSGGSDYHGIYSKPNVRIGYLNKEDLPIINVQSLTFINKKTEP